MEAESLQTTLSQELENTQIELENICKLKGVVGVTGEKQTQMLPYSTNGSARKKKHEYFFNCLNP